MMPSPFCLKTFFLILICAIPVIHFPRIPVLCLIPVPHFYYCGVRRQQKFPRPHPRRPRRGRFILILNLWPFIRRAFRISFHRHTPAAMPTNGSKEKGGRRGRRNDARSLHCAVRVCVCMCVVFIIINPCAITPLPPHITRHGILPRPLLFVHCVAQCVLPAATPPALSPPTGGAGQLRLRQL